jgi:hypothetical protein
MAMIRVMPAMSGHASKKKVALPWLPLVGKRSHGQVVHSPSPFPPAIQFMNLIRSSPDSVTGIAHPPSIPSRFKARSRAAAGIVLALVTSSVWVSEAATLPAELAGPAGSGSNPGFVVRTVQAPEEEPVANSFVRALRQLNGTLRNESGELVENEAIAGPNADGSYSMSMLNFERNGSDLIITDGAGDYLWQVPADPFPGIPGTGDHTTRFALEAVTYLELSAGTHEMGVSVSTDRTDVNDDDSFQIFVGANPRDFFAMEVARFQRNAPPFQSETHSETRFSIEVPVAGIYPFRVVYWQTDRGANLQWYHLLPSGDRILINDPFDNLALTAYQNSSVPRTRSPYVGEVSPFPGSAGNPSSERIEVVLFDGAVALNDATVNVTLNGTTLTPDLTQREGNRLWLEYAPDPNRTNPDNAIELTYADANGVSYTNAWSFQIDVSDGPATTVTGQWDFEAGDLAATVGQPLVYFDGPDGLTAAGTQFGTTAEFDGVADIGGEAARIMRVPGDLDRNIGYVMTHGIAPNGGGTLVNQYTLIMDIWVAPEGPGAAALLQVNSVNNTDDGDLFWQGNNFGQGAEGYNGRGTFTAGAWHRVAAAYDMAATPPVVVKYVDGIKQDDWTANQSLDNPRRALLPTAILFADGDQDERREMFVSSIQIRAGRMSDAELFLLGGPSASGIPRTLPRSTVTGQWDFEFEDLGATIGSPLVYLDGPMGLTAEGTRYGTASELEGPLLNGTDPRVMYVPGELSRAIGYIMEHRIAPNGGGTRVNQYTLIMDVVVGTTGPGAAAMLQISSLDNTDDGDLFWQGNNFGQGGDGYIGTGQFTAGEWHRVAAAYDMAANPPVVVKYVDGIYQHDWTANQGLDHPRRALLPTAILFADGDQDERREWWVSSIQIRAGALSKAELEALGGPEEGGIPVSLQVLLPEPPELSIGLAGDQVNLTWPAEASGYVLESTTTLIDPEWETVPGVIENSINLNATDEARFFRLRQ